MYIMVESNALSIATKRQYIHAFRMGVLCYHTGVLMYYIGVMFSNGCVNVL